MKKQNNGGHWPPTLKEIKEQIDRIGGVVATAKKLNKNRTTIWRWYTGKMDIDFANWELMRGRG